MDEQRRQEIEMVDRNGIEMKRKKTIETWTINRSRSQLNMGEQAPLHTTTRSKSSDKYILGQPAGAFIPTKYPSG